MSLILGPGGGQIVYPPTTRQWFEILPEPFNRDIDVVVAMMPVKWSIKGVETKDGRHTFGVMVSPSGTVAGLQVTDSRLKTWLDHSRVMQGYNVEMVSPAFIGPMSRFPQTLCSDLDRVPLVFVRDAMWREFLDLRRMWKPQKDKA